MTSYVKIFLLLGLSLLTFACEKDSQRKSPRAGAIEKDPNAGKAGEGDAVSVPTGDGTVFNWDGQGDQKTTVWDF